MSLLEFIFYSFWRFTGFAFLLYLVLHYTVHGLIRIVTRLFRTINILSRGWPPTHLDADGDYPGSVSQINPIENLTKRTNENT